MPTRIPPTHFANRNRIGERNAPQTLYYGDCLGWMREWPDGSVDLIYLAPPFNSNANYRNTMRYRIRAAINEWDLRRLYPDAQPETEGHGFDYSYDELPDLEKEVKDDETAG